MRSKKMARVKNELVVDGGTIFVMGKDGDAKLPAFSPGGDADSQDVKVSGPASLKDALASPQANAFYQALLRGLVAAGITLARKASNTFVSIRGVRKNLLDVPDKFLSVMLRSEVDRVNVENGMAVEKDGATADYAELDSAWINVARLRNIKLAGPDAKGQYILTP
jgi:hypothetical protein